jgi:hypothetical protein
MGQPRLAKFFCLDLDRRCVRTIREPGYPCPAAMTDAARKNSSQHIFEYQGETLYMHFALGLMG